MQYTGAINYSGTRFKITQFPDGFRLKNSKFLTVTNEYKRQQLIKHQLVTASDVDFTSWLKVFFKQSFFYLTMIICSARS